MRSLVPVTMSFALAVSGCSLTQRRDTEKAIAASLISDEQEFQLGLQVHEELKGQNIKFLNNQKVELYVESLARKLIEQANKERQLSWKWYVIDDPATINAFATPGGRIYVYTGLLLAADNEAEVIGVLGHEIGHVVGRHSARQLVAAQGLQTVSDMALGKDAADVAKVAAGLVGKGATLAYGRDMELEADHYGARYSSGANYDPRGLATFFEKLKAKYGDTPAVLTFLSTHPANSERITKVNEIIAAENLRGTELGVPTLKAIQAELGKK
ncbi:MAG: peptidase M48 [Archangium gephyra]|uniref:Peptidase M48 n=1 Tax=Archangium gephyra TaxID=48 RepID=A0A2W5V4U1_9BACT|nr:MAG: peptidase M48 [Archangium gephyra]